MKKHPLLICMAMFVLNMSASSKLENVFNAPSADAHPWVYWYWMNGNITADGIVADFKAMDEVGVRGVYLMNIGLHKVGKVKYLSPEWSQMVKLAVSEAKKRGIAVSFHCPGWSASGGPWITPQM